jgi:quercetin dioxygenase-like cupin family protein
LHRKNLQFPLDLKSTSTIKIPQEQHVNPEKTEILTFYLYGGISMSKLQALPADALPETPSSPGISRQLAFEGEGYLVLRSRSAPGTVSGWHSHGDHDVYGYLASGSARLEINNGEEAISLEKGDFFHVPARTEHREINPSSTEENEFILFLCGTGPLVINVDDSGQT